MGAARLALFLARQMLLMQGDGGFVAFGDNAQLNGGRSAPARRLPGDSQMGVGFKDSDFSNRAISQLIRLAFCKVQV